MSKNIDSFNAGKKYKRFWPGKYLEKSSLPLACFVLNHSIVSDKSYRRKYTGKWFKIKNTEKSNQAIYRILRFDPTLKAMDENSDIFIVVDWHGWLVLSNEDEDKNNAIPLTITKANFFEVLFKASWNHPEPTNKLAMRIAIILGGVSVLLGLFGLVIAFCK